MPHRRLQTLEQRHCLAYYLKILRINFSAMYIASHRWAFEFEPTWKKPGDQVQTIHKTRRSASSKFLPWLEARRGVTSWRRGHLANHLGELLCGGTLMLHATLLGQLSYKRGTCSKNSNAERQSSQCSVQLPAATADVLAVRQHLRRFTPARRCSC